jgi:hypothetical protein
MSSSNHFDLIYGELFGSSNQSKNSIKPNSSIGSTKVKKVGESNADKKIYEKMMKKRKLMQDKPSKPSDQQSEEP